MKYILLRQKGLRSHLSMVYSEKIFKFARGFSNVYDDPQPYDDTSFSGSSDSPKSFSSLQEFCDYLNPMMSQSGTTKCNL